MKESDDKDLEAYLNGSDGVSATYESLQVDKTVQNEKPSAALDETILNAARESVAGEPLQKKAIPSQVYSIAASVCVAVLVVSLFLNNEDELTGADLEALSVPLSDAPVLQRLEIMTVDNDAVDDQDATNTSAFFEQLEPMASRIEAEDLQHEAEAFSTANEISEQATARREERIAEPVAEAEAAAALVEQILEPDYRQNVDTWLLEIQRLSDIGNEDELAVERRLFAESYPDMDIDSALTEIQSSN